jgi:hypothetical protein
MKPHSIRNHLKAIVNTLLVALAIFTMLSVTAVVSAQKDAEEATVTAKTSVEYALPYPGILPGHPLYPIKMLRDRVLGSIISDPAKKADFYLLLADKRLNTGLFLVDYGKQRIGEETMSKGEKYFEQAVAMAKNASERGRDISSLVDRMEKAVLKHEEVLTEITLKGPTEIKGGVEQTLKMVRDLKLAIAELKSKK